MGVWVIRKPSDLRNVVTAQAGAFFLVPDEFEPQARAAWEEFIESFSMVEPDRDEPGLTTALIDAAAEPLAELRERGLQVVAVTSQGTMHGVPVRQTMFVFAGQPLWFRADGTNDPVHLLGARCEEGHRAFAGTEIAVRGWSSRDDIEQAFEGSVPWCPTCALADVETQPSS
ncbi:MAG TPA: hypothetical protein VFB42_06880 [Gaiellaceae bacterium]|nr:hypothetical protein [Gaiellaceae bacterium]